MCHEERGQYFARYPWAFTDEHTILGRIGAYLLKALDRNTLVDAGIGPMAFGLPGRLLGELENSGVQQEDFDVVFLTHLHGDHLGWSVTGEGEPTFTRARYVTQAVEQEDSGSHGDRALAPLERLGVVDLIYGEEPLSEEVIAVPTSGHSPEHASLLVSSGGEGAMVAGDVVVHAAQVAEPLWNIHLDEDKEQASFTREMLLDCPGDGLWARSQRRGPAATGRDSGRVTFRPHGPERRRYTEAARSSGERVSYTRPVWAGPSPG